MSAWWCLAAALAVLPVSATVLFDFETDDDLHAFHYEGRAPGTPVKELARVDTFATSGRGALRFTTPKWREGLPRWPAFEGKPTVTDWRGYDRLVYDATNLSEVQQSLLLFVAGGDVPTRQGLAHQAVLPARSYTQVVIPLAQLAEKKVDPANIRVLHFFTSDAPGDMVVHLDRLCLLRPGEPLPAVSTEYLRHFGKLQADRIAALRASLAATRERLRQRAAASPKAVAWVEAELAAVERNVAEFAALVERGDPAVLTAQIRLQALNGQVGRLDSLLDLRLAYDALRPKVTAPRDDLAVGFADSMVKVLPREVAVAAKPAAQAELSVARNETESLQVVVVPFERDLKGVQVRATALRGPGGASLPAERVKAVPVGYVQTKTVPPYGSSYVGWWPDPILDYRTDADVAKGDAQSFWLRVRPPKDQRAGVYQGRLEVVADGQVAYAAPFSVRVRDFVLPDRSPLPMAITFGPEHHPMPETAKQQAEWHQLPDYPVNAWRQQKLAWADFLADYYITYDSLYHRGLPDAEVLGRLHAQGRLGRYNLGYYDAVGDGPEAEAKWRETNLPRLRKAYEQAKALGILDHAYIYGADENPKEKFGGVQQAASILKAEFPGAMVMTTTYDDTFGQQSVIQAMDAFCPLTPKMDATRAEQARAAGRQVWWYICCGPHHPSANMFIEYPAIEGRLLMGALTAKYRPDGFLYYEISIWNSRHCIDGGPFTEWDPRSWTTYHGDGSWTCVGPGGTPLPTIRLENFRDGLEDYAYTRILAATIAKVEADPALKAKQARWLAKAKEALTVPAAVAKSGTDYTRDPAVLRAWRETLADAIEGAGVKAAEL